MKLRVFVTPQKSVLDSDWDGIVQAFEQGGGGRRAAHGPEQSVAIELARTNTPDGQAEAAAAVRKLNESFATLDRTAVTLRCELDGTVAPVGPPSACDVVATPTRPAASFHDLDGARVHDALPKVLAQPRRLPGGRSLAANSFPAETAAESGTATAVVRIELGGTGKFFAVAWERLAPFVPLAAARGTQIALVERLRALVCTGAAPWGVQVRFTLPPTLSPPGLDALRAAVDALAEVCTVFDVALIDASFATAIGAGGGEELMLGVAAIGVVAEEKHLTQAVVAAAGQNLVLLGEAPHELGGSHFVEVIHGLSTGDAPAIDLAGEKRLNKTLLALIRGRVVVAARHLATGGLLVAASEMLFAPTRTFGARLDVTPLGGARADGLLFGESQGRAIIAVAGERVGTVLSEAQIRGVPAVLIGEVTDGPTLSLKTRSLATEWIAGELRSQRKLADRAAEN